MKATIFGRRLDESDTPEGRLGSISAHLPATAKVVEACARHWPRADASDFEIVDGRRWRDKATGLFYVTALDVPLLHDRPQDTGVTAVVVVGGRIVFLRAEGAEQRLETQHLGEVTGRRAVESDAAPLAPRFVY